MFDASVRECAIIYQDGGLRNELQRGNYYLVPPLPARKSKIISSPPPDLVIIFTTSPPPPPLPTPPHIEYNVTVGDEKLENRLRYLLSDNPACAGRFLRGEYKLKPHDYDSNRALKRETNRILDKILAIIENLTKHDESLFIEGGRLKTGLNCLHNFNNEKRNYIKSGVEKDVLHLVEDLDRVMAKYKATYQIGTKSTTSEARKRKEQRKKRENRKLATGERNRRKRGCLISVLWEQPPLLRTLRRTYLVFPNWKLVFFFFFYLKDRQGMLAKPLQGQTVLPGKPRGLSCVSAPEGE